MLVDRRRSAFPAEFLGRVGLVWALVSGLLIAVNWSAITGLRFPDPDDAMRLLQVRDLIAGQSWFDLTQTRVDAPGGGVAMHWSRLVDLPLAAVVIALTPLIGASGAEMAALIAVPLVTLGITMLLAARIAWRLIGDEEAALTSLMIAISVPVLFQLGPMRIDHHGWQIVCALAAVNGLMARSPRVGGRVIGAALAIWLSISIEGLPLAAVIFAVLALRWLREREARVWLVEAMLSLTVTGAALFVLTRGIADLATYCDALSPLHIAMFGWGAIVLKILSRNEPAPRGIVVFGFAVAGGGALSMLLVSAPQCAGGGGFSQLDPLVARYWHANVLEGMPVWRQSLTTALQYLVTPLIALAAASNLAARSGDWLRRFWGEYVLILAAAIAVSVFVSRAGAVACVLAAPPLAWQLRHWLRAIRSIERAAPRIAALAAVACALLPAFPVMVLTNALPVRASTAENSGKAPSQQTECNVIDAGPELSQLPGGEIFAPLDISPELLLVSEHSVLATGHHRGDASMRLLIETALASPAKAGQTLRDRGTAYVALCPSKAEVRMYARIAPDGFAASLISGSTPDWLEPVDTGAAQGLKLWRVLRRSKPE